MKTQVHTPVFRMSYPNLFKAKRNELSGKDEYSVVALFKKGEDLSVLKAAAKAACEKKWGADQKKWPKNLRLPFRDQAEKLKEVDGKEILPPGHEAGAFFMNLKSNRRPSVVDQSVQLITDETEVYGGCYAKAVVNAYAYDQAGNRGVSFGLMAVQKVKDGESFGGGAMKPEDVFAPIEGAEGGDASSADELFG